jgi:hypothetical protein
VFAGTPGANPGGLPAKALDPDFRRDERNLWVELVKIRGQMIDQRTGRYININGHTCHVRDALDPLDVTGVILLTGK